MKWHCITRQGDTWDILAHDIYGSEKLMHILIAANPAHANTIVFTAGIQLIIPETPRVNSNSMRAPWDD
ncbi:tail protein X [Gilliamella sp. B2969]|uniref:tail protein X n=1 Tax=Gilliamella sp. B2969 TaxID=2818021 RepID=UPI00226AD328|nr:tail protein X [Gilliamella sp. B2969]MCX8731171.1 tail protein X [Gilliamella sp. B2969]